LFIVPLLNKGEGAIQGVQVEVILALEGAIQGAMAVTTQEAMAEGAIIMAAVTTQVAMEVVLEPLQGVGEEIHSTEPG
jgi:hypothetical protein